MLKGNTSEKQLQGIYDPTQLTNKRQKTNKVIKLLKVKDSFLMNYILTRIG